MKVVSDLACKLAETIGETLKSVSFGSENEEHLIVALKNGVSLYVNK